MPQKTVYKTMYLLIHCDVKANSDLSLAMMFCLGVYSTFMEKEIFEQPSSTEKTLRGRIDFDNYKGIFLYICAVFLYVFV